MSLHGDVVRVLNEELSAGLSPTEADVELAAQALRQRLRPGFRIFRIMTLTPEELDALAPGAPLGVHWTSDYSDMSTDAINLKDVGDIYLFEVTAAEADLDLPRTLAANINLPWEHEVLLRSGAALRIAAIWRCQDSASVQKVACVRIDLVGTIFHATMAVRDGGS